jgi:acetoin utilization protein AcuB
MFVGERMSSPVITIHPSWSISSALQLLQHQKIHHLPVVDSDRKLVGIVSEGDLLRASPLGSANLSALELNYIFNKMTVSTIMTRQVHTVSMETPLEEAARIMVDHHISGLPVVQDGGGEVLGIITETDIFKLFLELLGARESGIRIAAFVPNIPGEMVQLTKAIFDAGGNIVSMGTYLGERQKDRKVLIKVTDLTPQKAQSSLQPVVDRIIDIRECRGG